MCWRCQHQPKPTPTNDLKLHTFIKFKEYKINGKIGTPGQRDRPTF